jgi:hypothetical protein
MEIYGTTFDIDRIFKKCYYRDRFRKESNEESIEHLKQTKNEISNEEKFKELVKYFKTERKFSDTQIQKIRKEVIKLLDRTKKRNIKCKN